MILALYFFLIAVIALLLTSTYLLPVFELEKNSQWNFWKSTPKTVIVTKTIPFLISILKLNLINQ